MRQDDTDWQKDLAYEAIHHEAVMSRAAQEQCIFVFVEGDSEETALPYLFIDTLDCENLGVKVANYNGCGNLSAALRLLKVALKHERPIILTYDNDPQTIPSLGRCEKLGLLTELVYPFPIPQNKVVTFSDGYQGGAFEESFPVELFVKSVFECELLPPEIVAHRSDFEAMFDPKRPWLNQIKHFLSKYEFADWVINKPKLAEAMASECDELPPTYQALVDLVVEVREKHPVVHPDDVDVSVSWY